MHGEIGSSPLEVLGWRSSTSRRGEIKSSKLAISSSGSTRRREYSTPQDPRCRTNNNANEIRLRPVGVDVSEDAYNPPSMLIR
ncbi:hypothetical protein PI125_g22859 [Phytophthora idaei]|nr:hypothetical protein PI125_g22859 [Phytophthora idaei]KAG3136587.1 hypothetical protein PI126_g17755 [Phytophthora idaei]